MRRRSTRRAATLAVIAGTGGGIVRDLVLADTPPLAFEPWSVLVAAVAAVVVSAVLREDRGRWRPLYVAAGAAGLGLVTAAGEVKSLAGGLGVYPAILLGVLSGVGGGIARDVLGGRVPVVLHRKVYALAAVAGAVVIAALGTERTGLALVFGATTTLVIRLLAHWRRWEVPRLRT